MNISYAITYKNEREQVVKLINIIRENKHEDDEVVILQDTGINSLRLEDDESTGCILHERPFDGDFATHKNYLASKCTGDWIFQIDADETLSPELVANLHAILEMNPSVEMYEVPRINTITNVPEKADFPFFVATWRWNVSDAGWVNFPDYQTRLYKNNGAIKWDRYLHERLVGYKVSAKLPAEELYCLGHEKTFDRQFSQNAHYNRLHIIEALKQQGHHYSCDRRTFNGVEYYKWNHPYQGSWEEESLFISQELANIRKMIKGGVVLDIGAQTGYMSVAYAKCGADAVLAFEPNPATYEALEKQATVYPHIVPFNYAITDRYLFTMFHYSDNGLCNGGYASKLDAGVGVTGHKIPLPVYGVPVEFIGDQLLRWQNAPLTFIKIDAEGHDSTILREIRPIINRWKPIIQTEIYDGLSENEKRKLLDTIHEIGYVAYNMAESSDIDNLGDPITDATSLHLNSGHNLLCVSRDV